MAKRSTTTSEPIVPTAPVGGGAGLRGLAAALCLSVCAATGAMADDLAEGKKLAFDRKKGNCLACHMIDDGQLAGLIGPPIVAMQARFPDKADLRAQVWDATQKNPNSMMPPFGKHKVLTDDEIDKIVDYIYTL